MNLWPKRKRPTSLLYEKTVLFNEKNIVYYFLVQIIWPSIIIFTRELIIKMKLFEFMNGEWIFQAFDCSLEKLAKYDLLFFFYWAHECLLKQLIYTLQLWIYFLEAPLVGMRSKL